MSGNDLSRRSVFVPAKLLQSCQTLCNPMDYSPPGSFVHGILQARILDWVSMPSFRGSSWPMDRTPCLMSPASEGRFFTTSTTWEAPLDGELIPNLVGNTPFLPTVIWNLPPHWSKQMFLWQVLILYIPAPSAITMKFRYHQLSRLSLKTLLFYLPVSRKCPSKDANESSLLWFLWAKGDSGVIWSHIG